MQEARMDELFTRKVKAAAIAGWWTVLVAYCILLLQWLAYVAIMTRQPPAMQCLWGAGVAWPEIRTIWLWAMVVFKFILGTMVFVTLWLTFWARRLARP
jgi:hypothetical protein